MNPDSTKTFSNRQSTTSGLFERMALEWLKTGFAPLRWLRLRIARWPCAVILVLAAPTVSSAQRIDEDFFEERVRPVLVDNCLECHGNTTPSAGLRLDAPNALRTDDGQGSVILPGNSQASRLVRALRQDDSKVSHMPPGKKLSESEIRAIENWIDAGAAWPESVARTNATAASAHWSFQPMKRASSPRNEHPKWNKEPIDRWIFHAMQSRGLLPSPPASSHHLARRLTFDLTGLPPTPQQIELLEGFENEPERVEQLVDELLESTAFAEHWARHWLDVARYADTLGELEDAEDFNPYAYLYRDWVIQAFQNDLPYDEFLRLQLCADQMVEPHSPDLAALGFLTVGLKFENSEPDIIDDRLDTIFRGLQGLSISCARCHDHKYDPISTEDYYSLYAIFSESHEKTVPIFQRDEDRDEFALYESELRKIQFAFDRFVDEQRQARYGQPYHQVASYLLASSSNESHDRTSAHQDGRRADGLHSALIYRYRGALEIAKAEHSPIFAPWIAYTQSESLQPDEINRLAREYSQWASDNQAEPSSDTEEMDQQAEDAEQEKFTDVAVERDYDKPINPCIAEFFTSSPPQSKEELAERYGDLFRSIADQWRAEMEAAWKAGTEAPVQLVDEHRDEIRRLLFDEDPGLDVDIETLKNSLNESLQERFEELLAAINQFKASDSAPPQARVLSDGGEREQHVFIRGNPERPGAQVQPRFLSVLDAEGTSFSWESARGELAQAICDPHNPLTARVWVNRVWRHLFGQGLVETPSDFGLRGSAPSHPELLDSLALDLIKDQWSTRNLIRRIVLSAAYQQSSRDRADMHAIDPTNRYLWRMNRKRLTSESLRDSLLATAEQLDLTLGGKAVRMDETENRRRTIYSIVNRRYASNLAKTFDFANAMMHSPQRYETIVPQQTLWLLNSPFITTLLQSDSVLPTNRRPDSQDSAVGSRDDAGANASSLPEEEIVAAIYQQVLQREPTNDEVQLASSFLKQAALQPSTPILNEYSAWRYATALLHRNPVRLTDLTEFSQFDDDGWSMDGFRLDAAGGEFGEDSTSRVLVRRWIVPADGALKINSVVSHMHVGDEPGEGDGITAVVLRNGESVLAKCSLKNSENEVHGDLKSVRGGETIDFVVHRRKNSAHDRFDWDIDLVLMPADDSRDWITNSQRHFRTEAVPLTTPLSGPAQLMQVLWMSNEFLYID